MPFNFGLSDKEGSLPFLINPSNIGGSAIIDENNPSIKDSIQINVKTFDGLNEFKNVPLLILNFLLIQLLKTIKLIKINIYDIKCYNI